MHVSDVCTAECMFSDGHTAWRFLEDEASWCAMEAADEIKKGGTEVRPTATPDPPETGGVDVMRIGKGNHPRNVGTVARKATGRASAGRSAPIRREPVPDIPTKGISSNRTTSKDREKPEKGLSS